MTIMKLTSMITGWTPARVGQPPYHITLPNMVISSVIRPENTVGSSLYTAHGPPGGCDGLYMYVSCLYSQRTG